MKKLAVNEIPWTNVNIKINEFMYYKFMKNVNKFLVRKSNHISFFKII